LKHAPHNYFSLFKIDGVNHAVLVYLGTIKFERITRAFNVSQFDGLRRNGRVWERVNETLKPIRHVAGKLLEVIPSFRLDPKSEAAHLISSRTSSQFSRPILS